MDDITSLAERLRFGSLDLLEYLNSVCDVIETDPERLLAITPNTFSRAHVLAMGRDLLERFPNPGEERPALFGIPFGAKDVIFSKDYPTCCQSILPPSLWDTREDAVVVDLLKQSGALLVCKTSTTEFASTAPWATTNPWDEERTPGGSSSGSPPGVAVGYFPLALGTQGTGSTIRPASYNNVVGFLSSHLRISIDGIMPVSSALDDTGIFVNSVQDLKLIAPILMADWNAEKLVLKKDFVLGIVQGSFFEQADEAARVHFLSQISLLESAGIKTKLLENFVPNHADIWEKQRRITGGQMLRTHHWFQKYRFLYRPETQGKLDRGLSVSDEELAACISQQEAFQRYIMEYMEVREIDAIVTLSSTGHAPLGLESTGDPAMNVLFSYSRLPIASIPMPLDQENLPLGMQLVGKYYEDEEFICICERIEEILSRETSRQLLRHFEDFQENSEIQEEICGVLKITRKCLTQDKSCSSSLILQHILEACPSIKRHPFIRSVYPKLLLFTQKQLKIWSPLLLQYDADLFRKMIPELMELIGKNLRSKLENCEIATTNAASVEESKVSDVAFEEKVTAMLHSANEICIKNCENDRDKIGNQKCDTELEKDIHDWIKVTTP